MRFCSTFELKAIRTCQWRNNANYPTHATSYLFDVSQQNEFMTLDKIALLGGDERRLLRVYLPYANLLTALLQDKSLRK